MAIKKQCIILKSNIDQTVKPIIALEYQLFVFNRPFAKFLLSYTRHTAGNSSLLLKQVASV